ncbi:MAG: YeiH family putative sulfate export transporter [Betaproteobacteria bacterium]|nr:YeiH family putative sulfate export transporter [Betaproteobacteria bacterium]MDE2056786.1 YeiH family putative sulfate export transporter [Betaproteobacteria bacterium]
MQNLSFRLSGLFFTFMGALISIAAGSLPFFSQHHITSLTLAILLGIVLGNISVVNQLEKIHWGVDFSKSQLLKLGVILYGLKVTFSEIMQVGLSGILIDLTMVISTFSLAYLVGRKWLKEDLQTVILIGAGSSICGAAAILATEPVIKAQAHKVSIAVATVVIFGTLSMFLEPIVFQYSGLPLSTVGTYLGSTIHEVAQVVVAGRSVNEHVSHIAVTEKMLRVMMLPFFLIALSFTLKNQSTHQQNRKITIPWFAIAFILLTVIHSFVALPKPIIQFGIDMDNVILAMAMFALGVRTHKSALKTAGIKPIILASVLFIFLTSGGLLINSLISKIIN